MDPDQTPYQVTLKIKGNLIWASVFNTAIIWFKIILFYPTVIPTFLLESYKNE